MQADAATYLEAVRAHIETVPGVSSSVAYAYGFDGVTEPTAYIDISEVEQAEPSIIDYWDTLVTLRIVIAVPRDLQSKITAWNLAVSTGLYCRQAQFSQAQPAQLVSVARESTRLDNDVDACEILLVQRVRWQSPNILSDGGWQVSPSTVLASQTPDVGPDYIDDYEEISSAP